MTVGRRQVVRSFVRSLSLTHSLSLTDFQSLTQRIRSLALRPPAAPIRSFVHVVPFVVVVASLRRCVAASLRSFVRSFSLSASD